MMREFKKFKSEHNGLKKQLAHLNSKWMISSKHQTTLKFREYRNEYLKPVIEEIARFLNVEVTGGIETVHHVQSNKTHENRPKNPIDDSIQRKLEINF
ncbi:hypothetical protein JTB14_037644 [Gonioctena quinquepunctata]|nr:hypothetical protein JTB14_037644 [Gonioctena quinquepunctata]